MCMDTRTQSWVGNARSRPGKQSNGTNRVVAMGECDGFQRLLASVSELSWTNGIDSVILDRVALCAKMVRRTYRSGALPNGLERVLDLEQMSIR